MVQNIVFLCQKSLHFRGFSEVGGGEVGEEREIALFGALHIDVIEAASLLLHQMLQIVAAEPSVSPVIGDTRGLEARFLREQFF